jgi:hypothetical protein
MRPTAFERGLPAGLRQRLENARLDLRALFRASDQLLIGQDLPRKLRRLFELDADFAEVLHLMDLAPGGIDTQAMLRDTEASLRAVSAARTDFLASLREPDRHRLEVHVPTVRAALTPRDAYIDIPGRDPHVRP